MTIQIWYFVRAFVIETIWSRSIKWYGACASIVYSLGSGQLGSMLNYCTSQKWVNLMSNIIQGYRTGQSHQLGVQLINFPVKYSYRAWLVSLKLSRSSTCLDCMCKHNYACFGQILVVTPLLPGGITRNRNQSNAVHSCTQMSHPVKTCFCTHLFAPFEMEMRTRSDAGAPEPRVISGATRAEM